jgi:hypothetical protein
MVPNVVKRSEGWEPYIVTDGVMVGILLGEGSQCGKRAHHINTHIHNILSTAPQLSISQKALGMLTEDGNVMPKHIGATIHN